MVNAHISSIFELNTILPLSTDTLSFIKSNFKTLSLSKNEFLIKKGDVVDKIFVVRKGLVRGFDTISDHEITYWISVDGETCTSSAFFATEKSEEYIQALEDTILDYLTIADLRKAIKNFKDFNELYIKNLEKYYQYAQKRALISRIPNAADRYSYFLTHYDPRIVARTPDKYIASFLGIKPETLSRLKRKR